MTNHSFLPPSGASAWSKCAMWPTMNARYPQDESAEAQEGTAAHWVMAEMLASRTPPEGSLTPNGQAVTAEMIEGAEMVTQTLTVRSELHIEETSNILAIHPDCFGTPDIWVFDRYKAHLYIIDYKFGHRFVDEYWNTQGLLYMLGIIGQLQECPEEVSFTIVQPRCFYRGEPVRTHTYYINHATDFIRPIREAAERATQPNPTATTGPHCEYCPGRHACPTLQKAAYSDAETSTDQQPLELTPQAAALELRMLDRALTRLTARVDGLREQTLANIKAGAHVAHYKAERGRSTRKWKVSPEEVINLDPRLAAAPKVVTPTQAKQKLLLDNDIIATYSEIIPGGVKLVESDSKEATRVFRRHNV